MRGHSVVLDHTETTNGVKGDVGGYQRVRHRGKARGGGCSGRGGGGGIEGVVTWCRIGRRGCRSS